MSHFYGVLRGSRGEATRCGTKSSGITTIAASWNGAIQTQIRHDPKTGKDHFEIWQIPWNSTGIRKLISTGIIGESK